MRRRVDAEHDPARLLVHRLARAFADSETGLHLRSRAEPCEMRRGPETAQAATAPIVGAPRVLRAAGAITEALGVAIAITADAASEADG